MTGLDDREKSFEGAFAHNEEMHFKARARRNRLFGTWVAEQLGLKDEAIADYAKSIVSEDLKEDGDSDVLRKVMQDLRDARIDISEHRLEKKLIEDMQEAQKQIASEA